ncbi:MerR family mercuric resistance operon transcriptional regulator [Tahibacter aquaticus]|uniref:MerR family mercuric resistance operon transcriptional regulator n=1 Tax=Tahibacter aquaticus TaxID=520092 RepID=A0A4R6YKV0_9GAMM|nr:helix-turn-helix domain-containing protein [Tahibacter aquaticus]TDR37730.1 MerR family mercuric resistance operon transcriptional regulator [Tahibacter aquaticus]
MKISEAAAASGCHLETIRYYERIGLLSKAARRDNGYRVYTHAEVERLRFITRGRELGFSLEEIQSLLALAEQTDMPCADVDRMARQHLADIQGRIQALQRMAQELARTIEGCAGGARARCAILGDLQAPVDRTAPNTSSAPKGGRRAAAGRPGAGP